MPKRSFRKLFYSLLILLLAVAGYLLWPEAPPPEPIIGRLQVEAPAETVPDTFRVGDFRIIWPCRAAEGMFLRITHRVEPGHVVWESIPGESFINAARGQETISGSRGHYTISDDRKQVYEIQSVGTPQLRDSLLLFPGRLYGDGDSLHYALRFSPTPEGHLRFEIQVPAQRANRVYFSGASRQAERFFGFGEQFSYFDLKGRRVPVFISEQGIGRGVQPLTWGANLTAGAGGDWYNSYACVPHYLTSERRSLALENYEYAVFDLRREERVQIEVFSSWAAGRIIYASTPLAAIESYTRFAGRMRPLPDWLLRGAVIGIQGGSERVREIRRLLTQHQVPLAAFWLQDWVGQRTTSFGKQLWWNWELDRERYPQWPELRRELDSAGVKLMTYINPFLVPVETKENHRRNLFQEARARGFLVRNEQGEPYLIRNTDFSAGLLDLTQPDARAWIRAIIREELIGNGASGWMADFGEALPPDARLASQEDAFRVHNRYPEDWAKVNREAIESQPDSLAQQLVFFSRSGYTRSPRYSPLFWLGDQLVSWDGQDGIKTAVTGLLSSGISGFSFNHSDIGGYTAITHPLKDYHRSPELFQRWAELAAFNVVFRTHEGNQPEANHQFYDDPATLAHFARCARIYAAWGFYRRELVAEAARSGAPVVRHLFLHYPGDPRVLAINHEQFLVGSELLVAPVLDPGVTEVNVYLPRGEWVHLWSGNAYGSAESGTEITVPAPIGEPAVFYRKDSSVGERFREALGELIQE